MADDEYSVTVVVEDDGTWRMDNSLDADTALTMIAVVSEDPESWGEMAEFWPRYWTPPVPESLKEVPMRSVGKDEAMQAIEETEVWGFIDLDRKRVLTGRGYDEVGRKEAYAMVIEDDGTQHCPLMVNLAPWWEMHENVGREMIKQPREDPMERPYVNRDVLFGEPLLQYIARRCMDIVQSDRWAERDTADDEANYPFTVEVHRDWLLTPREELDGRIPREMLHGGIGWVDGLAHGQRLRCDDGGKIVAVPEDIEGYERDPMGREEVVIYFDLCRELIASAWSWCEKNEVQLGLNDVEKSSNDLVEHLKKVKAEWMAETHEISATPAFIIECSRRRVPRGAGVSIEGMSERQPEPQMADEDCPLCQMMGEGGFGVAFTGLDGHHLELDEEFAFSLCETREEWEEQQREFDRLSEEFERELDEEDLMADNGEDDFEPTWANDVPEEPIPGDEDGHMKLAFLLAEIISVMEDQGPEPGDIGELNDRFTAFRNSEPEELYDNACRLSDYLESLTDRYPEIISRVADFCSRIDEHVCSVRLDDEDDVDLPF